MTTKKTTKTTKKKDSKKEDTQEAIKNAISNIRTKFGEDSIMVMGEETIKKIDSVSTGSIGLDYALGIGGLPLGRVVEIFGPESSGKTTLALHVIAEAQKAGGVCAFIDAEHALDLEYGKKIGVKIKELILSQPDTGEQALEIVDTLVRSGNVQVIVVDSVAALTPAAEIEGDMSAQHIGRQARLMSQALRKLAGNISKSQTTVIFINQLRMQIGVMFGNPETTPGGKALKYYSSARLDVRRIQQIKKGDEVVGGRVRVKVVKNKVAPPFKTAEFDLLYNEGITREGELLALGEKYKIISKAGASYSYGEEKLGRGYDAARTKLKENKVLTKKLRAEIEKAMKE